MFSLGSKFLYMSGQVLHRIREVAWALEARFVWVLH